MSWLKVFCAACLPWVIVTHGCSSSDDDDNGEGDPGSAGDSGSSGDTGGPGEPGHNGGSAGVAGESGGPGAGGSADAGAGGDGADACVDANALEVLGAHIHDLESSAALLSGHASDREAVSFLLAPGMTEDSRLAASFATLFEVCSMATEFVEFCDGGHCSRLACTGEGAGWTSTVRLESPIETGDFSFESAEAQTAWADGASGITFTIDIAATGPNSTNWAMSGDGVMDGELLEVTETFPSLFAAGEATLLAESNPESLSGALSIDGVEVARFDADERLVATGQCPRP